MATPTISAGWAPPDQACLRINDYWIWDYQAPRDARTVLGGPSQITDCLPTPWASAVTYEATGCPPQYTSACRGPDFNAPVTCCPTAYSFSCLPQSLHTGPHAIQFRCQSRHAASGNIVVTRTAFAANTIAAESRVRSTNEHLFALALMYTTPTATTSSTIAATTTPGSDSERPPAQESSSLTAGQAAGVGVGAAVAVILVATLAWFLWRRRRSSKALFLREHQIPPYSRGDLRLRDDHPPSELSAVPPKMYELPTK